MFSAVPFSDSAPLPGGSSSSGGSGRRGGWGNASSNYAQRLAEEAYVARGVSSSVGGGTGSSTGTDSDSSSSTSSGSASTSTSSSLSRVSAAVAAALSRGSVHPSPKPSGGHQQKGGAVGVVQAEEGGKQAWDWTGAEVRGLEPVRRADQVHCCCRCSLFVQCPLLCALCSVSLQEFGNPSYLCELIL